jgi:hypothetical protein
MPWMRVLWCSSGCAKRGEWQRKKILTVRVTPRRNSVSLRARESVFRTGHNAYFLHSWLGRFP